MVAFQINYADNVATALDLIKPGKVILRGDARYSSLTAISDIPIGHKIALTDIAEGEDIIKYGVVIGCATKDIPKGSWVHLHNICSKYDKRSCHLDIMTGAPKDISYE